jgi:hypothetical protein
MSETQKTETQKKPTFTYVIRDQFGRYYDVAPEELEKFRMTDDQIEAFLRSFACPWGSYCTAYSPNPSAFVRAVPSSFVRAVPSQFVRAVPSAYVRAVPSHFSRAVPSSLVRAAPSQFVRAAPSQFVRAVPSAAVPFTPSSGPGTGAFVPREAGTEPAGAPAYGGLQIWLHAKE